MNKEKLEKIEEGIYEVPKTGNMNVPGKIFVNEKLFEQLEEDSIKQVENVAKLPEILKNSIGMSDIHIGYGFPIGGVAAFDIDSGIVSPGGVGYDIGCSVRLLKTNLTKKDILKKQKEIADTLYRKIPSGVGRGSPFQIHPKEFPELLKGGAKYMVEKGYGVENDYLHTEENGRMKNADPAKVSQRAIKRGIGQVGTLGAGNHFLEVQFVEKVLDSEACEVYGLKENQVTIMIHCGSRGLGHQIASDYIKKMEQEYGISNLPDRELINAPIKSSLGQDYLKALSCAINFAYANKQIITHWVREEMKNIFPLVEIDVVYDISHNIAKMEKHNIDGKECEVCVHRKGATRSFGPGREEICEDYRKVGQPVLIPGSMGTSSYVLKGTKKAEELTFGSSVHGAGRVMSRSSALRELKSSEIQENLDSLGIEVRAGGKKSLIEEAPNVYKDIDEVVETVHDLGISTKVAKLKPLVVIKG